MACTGCDGSSTTKKNNSSKFPRINGGGMRIESPKKTPKRTNAGTRIGKSGFVRKATLI